jgi:Spy/CpxP family protein refolding chaperone
MNLKWNQITIALIVGLFAGALVADSPAAHDFMRKWDTHPPKERIVKRFAKRLNLTEEQKTQVAAVLEQKRAKMDAVFNEMKPKFEQVRAETSDEIRKLLNPEQQKKFAVMEAQMSERFNKRFPPHH